MPRTKKILLNLRLVNLRWVNSWINLILLKQYLVMSRVLRIYWDLSMDARKLVEICEKEVGWKLTPMLYSFTDDFETIRNDLLFSELKDENEIKKFIEICDNRIEHAKTFLSDIATVLGFFITSLAFMVVLSSMKIKESDKLVDPFLNLVISYGIIFTIFIALLLLGIIILSILLFRYRTRVHAWAAFKEAAILNKS